MNNSRKQYLIALIILTSILTVSCTESSNDSIMAPDFEKLDNSPTISATLPTCSTRNLRTWLISTQQWDLDGYISPVVCPPYDGGDGYLQITTYGKEIETTDGIEFVAEKWNDTTSVWEYHWSSGYTYQGDPIYIYESDAYGNAFNGMDGSDRFRLRVYEAFLVGTGGSGSGSATDSIRVTFDLND